MCRLLGIIKEREYLIYCLALSCIFIGLFYFRAMLSIGMISLFVLSFVCNPLSNLTERIKQRKWFLVVMLLVVPYLIGGAYSSDLDEWWKSIVMKVPFLTLPVALVAFDKKKFVLEENEVLTNALLAFFVITTLPLIVEFISSYEEVLVKYSRGKTLNTPINHIRYSLVLGFGVVLGLHTALQKLSRGNVFSGLYKLTLSVVLFIVIHLLAVRSGLLCLYIGLFIYFFIYIYKYKQWKAGIFIFVVFVGFLSVMPRVFPTIKKKISYTLFSLKKLKKPQK